MYRIFNRFMYVENKDKDSAILMARLNAACVMDQDDNIIIDCRTEESEQDERG